MVPGDSGARSKGTDARPSENKYLPTSTTAQIPGTGPASRSPHDNFGAGEGWSSTSLSRTPPP